MRELITNIKRKEREEPQSNFSAHLCALCGLLCLISSTTTQAQRYQQQQKFAFEFWHEGKVVIEGGDTLRGQVQYNMQTELVQLQINNKLETLTPRKVVFFEIFDQTVNRYRQFYSLPFALTGQYKAPVFF